MNDRFQIKTESGRVISIWSIRNESGTGIIIETSDAIGASWMTKIGLSRDEAAQIRNALTERLN